jgi:hypothetical protein
MNNPMLTKMSSKLTHLQKGPSTPTNANTKPTDWKKWAKRGAMGVAGIGALALGVDAAGDMFSGAEGLVSDGGGGGGGGDFIISGGGGEDFTSFEGSGDAGMAMDAQTAVDASAVEAQMALVGQENAMMLCDPVGTTCEYSFFFFRGLPCWYGGFGVMRRRIRVRLR